MLMEEQFTVFILNRTRGEKMNNDDVFVYLCPICKTPNPKSVKYCIKCGHWLLSTNFPAQPLNEKEYYDFINKINSTQKKSKRSVFPTIFYSLFFLFFLAVPLEGKILLALLIILYGIINIIVPLRKLLIYKRSVGSVILLGGIFIFIFCSVLYDYNIRNTTIVNISEFKSQCTTIPYEKLARETERYVNSKIKLTGQVFQVQENGNRVVLMVNVTKGNFDIYQDPVWVNYLLKKGEKHILQGDIIDLWGTVKGRKSYITVLGNKMTVPEINAVIIELKQ